LELEDQRTHILGGHLTLLNYALQHGYSFDGGNLYEYDFNLILCSNGGNSYIMYATGSL
jgi:hypothetical protein